jgi:hypothetical protein
LLDDGVGARVGGGPAPKLIPNVEVFEGPQLGVEHSRAARQDLPFLCFERASEAHRGSNDQDDAQQAGHMRNLHRVAV